VSESTRLGWRQILLIAIGLLVLIVPTWYIVGSSRAIFREECRQSCEKIEMDFRVKAVGHRGASGDLRYPGECECIKRTGKQWWQFWR
jgi:hypothetical protein